MIDYDFTNSFLRLRLLPFIFALFFSVNPPFNGQMERTQQLTYREREMEFDLIHNPHPHPLIFYHQGKSDGRNVCCSKCHQPWRPPAFGCSDCNFHIHQSCIDLPLEIHTPFHFHFHHQCPLSLATNDDDDDCNCCGQRPYGNVYRCFKCSFHIDIQCAIADTKANSLQQTAGGEFRHFAHPHPLILRPEQQMGNRKVICLMCESHIESGSTYFCSTCDSHFHQHCAELPREILKLDYFHDHSLFLVSNIHSRGNVCQSCRNECSNFFYHCPQCVNFSLHVACVPLFKHQHEFYDFRKVLPEFDCQVCGKEEYERIPWVCKTCHLFAHKKCAELPSIIYVSKHDHPLTLTFSFKEFIPYQCEICNGGINIRYTAAYFCSQCKYIVHLDCATYLQIEDIDQSMRTLVVDPSGNAKNGFNLKEDIQIQENEIILRHFSHNHNLSLCPGDQDRPCAGCMTHLSTLSQSYGCSQCDFYLHQECARLPRRYKNSFFHSHELSMVYIPDFVFSCAVCLQYCHGFAYYCKECHYTIDIQCASASFPFTHPTHEHALFHYNINGKEKHKCKACRKGLQDKEAFGCNNCNFYLDRRCAHLPLEVRNRFDEHPLILTAVNQQTDSYVFQFEHNISLPFFKQWSSTGNEYYCDICEEEREEDDWFYSCKLCCFAAHINCVLGDYPFLKSAQFEGHQHPLSLVGEGKKGYSACGECGDSCEGNLAFECGDLSCKFNVHAFGPCYHNQLTQGRITFTMPSLRYRSIPLFPEKDQEDRSNLILCDDAKVEEEDDERKLAMSLRQYGGGGGKLWDDRVFSSIKRVVISHGEYIHSIQTEYYDHNGSLTWSDRHGGNGGYSSEVELNYPNEYLISIHGYMGNFEDYYMIRSLVLESNKRIYGPFGKEEGTRFSFPTTRAIIVGFHGRSSYCLDSIGIKVVQGLK